jgi:hypothetical protein
MRRFTIILGVVFGLAAAGCADPDPDSATGSGDEAITSARSFVAKGTGYFPDPSPMEGGSLDLRGAKLHTLQDFLAGRADYVSVAMDSKAFKYGQRLRIAQVNAKFGEDVVFRVVDTGGAFRGKGTTRIDVCTADQKASLDPTINAMLNIDVVDEPADPPHS